MDTVYVLTETDTCTFLIHGVYSNDIVAKDAFSMVLTARIRDVEKDKDAFRDKTGLPYEDCKKKGKAELDGRTIELQQHKLSAYVGRDEMDGLMAKLANNYPES